MKWQVKYSTHFFKEPHIVSASFYGVKDSRSSSNRLRRPMPHISEYRSGKCTRRSCRSRYPRKNGNPFCHKQHIHESVGAQRRSTCLFGGWWAVCDQLVVCLLSRSARPRRMRLIMAKEVVVLTLFLALFARQSPLALHTYILEVPTLRRKR